MHSNYKILARCEFQYGDVDFCYSVSCSLVDCSEHFERIVELFCAEMEVAVFIKTFVFFCQTTWRLTSQKTVI